MVTKTIDLNETASVKELLALLEANTEIILTENDHAVARIVSVEQPEIISGPRIAGLFPGIWMSDDFDDPLPDEFWLGEDA